MPKMRFCIKDKVHNETITHLKHQQQSLKNEY